MTFTAFEPYGQFFAELYKQAAASDCALRTSVALRRMRNRAVNAIFAHVPDAVQPPRTKAWIADTLTR